MLRGLFDRVIFPMGTAASKRQRRSDAAGVDDVLQSPLLEVSKTGPNTCDGAFAQNEARNPGR